MAEFGLGAVVVFSTQEGTVHRMVKELLPDSFVYPA